MIIIPMPEVLKAQNRKFIKHFVKKQVKRNKITLPYEIDENCIVFNKGKQSSGLDALMTWRIWQQ